MDKNSLSWIGGVVVFALTLFFVIYFVVKTNPGSPAVSTLSELQPLQDQAITSDALVNVSKLTKNGEIPVVVPAENIGKDNPFGG